MPSNYLLLIIITVVISALAQVLLKVGANSLTNKVFTGLNFESASIFFSVLFTKTIFLGMLLYIFSATLWIWVLTKVDLSLAYPFVSLSFLITFAFGTMLFNEPITTMKVIGTILIMLGCFFITQG